MGFMSKLFDKKQAQPEEAVIEHSVECPHTVLVPHWDSVEDMGNESRATAFICESCGVSFEPEEAERLKSDAADKLKKITASSEEEVPAEEPARS